MTKLTKSLKQYLEKYDIASDDIRISAVLDVNENFGFSDTYLVLTEDRLVLAAYEERKSNHVHQFGGYSRMEQDEQADMPAIRIFELENTLKLAVIREISGGALYAETKEGDIRIGRFTNSRMGEVQRFIGAFDKVKKGEKLTEEDIEGKNKMECCPKCGLLYPDQERKICPKCMDKKSIMLRVLGYYKPYIPQIIIMFLQFVIGVNQFSCGDFDAFNSTSEP